MYGIIPDIIDIPLDQAPRFPVGGGEEVAEKFRGCLEYAGHWPRERVEELVAVVKDLETVPDVAELVRTKLTIQ